ncbi:peptide deformylase [Actinomarinicola tropica]|uniref:Peptide deformylase n=1 Tax=Actinomarinicola tropica TaxID=2789776 RepID=A0A5Q2RFT7_9ACTN|nr:peptide deformylase [Actinomarinicola tropica]QGG94573.1 peptide deformylase [Actinomarinicola tropica]
MSATEPTSSDHDHGGCAPVTLWGNPVLRKRCTPVTVFDGEVQRLVDQLFETMYAIPTGVGLAANQIGRTERVFVFDCRDGLAAAVVNPTVTVLDADLQEGGEGCLSLPGMGLITTRALRCRVTGQDATGAEIAYEGEGLRARCFQHETDHLNGKLYIDLHPTKVRKRLEDEMRAAEWFGEPALDPTSESYRRAQGDDEDGDEDEGADEV